MIDHGPLPERDFTIIRNEALRDERLSYRARGILAYVLSQPPDWRGSAEEIANAAPKGEGRDAVRRALRELEEAGYLIRVKVRDENGRFVSMVCWRGYHTSSQVNDTAEEFPQVTPATENPPRETSAGLPALLEELEELDVPVMQCPPRSQVREGDDGPKPRSTTSRRTWRQQDRDLWRELIGGSLLITPDNRWAGDDSIEKIYTADAVYNVYRQRLGKKWPGRWLQSIVDALGGVEEWLVDEGYEVVPAAQDGDTTPRCRCGRRMVTATSQRTGTCITCRTKALARSVESRER